MKLSIAERSRDAGLTYLSHHSCCMAQPTYSSTLAGIRFYSSGLGYSYHTAQYQYGGMRHATNS